jgi:inhibitor of KinA sporulation pathway (predicted exonuclease)
MPPNEIRSTRADVTRGSAIPEAVQVRSDTREAPAGVGITGHEMTAAAATSTTMATEGRWSHFLVLDFEATCERNDPTQRQWSEIIEWPCVLLDATTLQPLAEFQRYVRPTGRPALSTFCTELTGITQEQVDAAEPIEVVRRQFCAWLPGVLGTDDLSRVLPVTCGEPDLSVMLPGECRRKRLQVPPVLTRYCNVKKPFAEHLGVKAGGMTRMLSALRLHLVITVASTIHGTSPKS